MNILAPTIEVPPITLISPVISDAEINNPNPKPDNRLNAILRSSDLTVYSPQFLFYSHLNPV
jgi:hypothetical protein